MTTRTITGTYASGYAMTPPVTDLTVAASGYVEGNGVTSPASGMGAYTLVNDGKVKAGPWGVYLYSGGSLTNGAANIATAKILGGIGVIVGSGAGTVVNYDLIEGVGVSNGGAEGNGVVLSQGGAITNGSASDTTALIAGATAASDYGQAATIRNFGTLEGVAGLPYGRGVYLDAGGVITNGSATDTKALIGVPLRYLVKSPSQYYDNPIVAKDAPATVNNFGVIYGPGAAVVKGNDITGHYYAFYLSIGIDLQAGGRVTNHAGGKIVASYPIVIGSGRGTVLNYGVIAPDSPGDVAGGPGVFLSDGGLVVNGSAADTTARLIGNYDGLVITGAAGTVRNFGTIDIEAADNYVRGPLGTGASLAAAGASLPRYGAAAVVLEGAGVVTNYGVIIGSVDFRSSADRLVVEAGASFNGQVFGGGGTLDLASGAGSISQIAGYPVIGGYVSVYGALPVETFDAFGTLEVASGTQITLAGTGVIGYESVTVLDLAGRLTVTGALASGGAIIGAGTLSMQGGQTTFGGGTRLSVAHVTESGAATSAVVATTLAYAGTWAQTGGTVSVNSGGRLTFTGAADSFAGTLTGAGAIAFSGGADVLTNATLSVANMTLKGATLTVSNVILEGGGSLSLTNLATNMIKGASATATFTNAGDRITGAGDIGDGAMLLINTGVIVGNQTTVLTIDTGASAVVNAGLIESASTGGVTIAGPISNSGTLMVTKGTLTVDGAVSGAGTLRIGGGVAHFAAAFAENVTFTSATGVLELAKATAYTGQITGFSKSGTTSLDLLNIGFASGATKASYSGAAASGVLTVTDGTHTAKITLKGNYTASTFTVASDGHGGTSVIDPTLAHPPARLALIAAMAAFAGRTSASAWSPPTVREPRSDILVKPA